MKNYSFPYIFFEKILFQDNFNEFNLKFNYNLLTEDKICLIKKQESYF